MTQLPKGTAERTVLIKKAEKERPLKTKQQPSPHETDAAFRDAREKAEIERVPGAKGASAEEAGEEQTRILDD